MHLINRRHLLAGAMAGLGLSLLPGAGRASGTGSLRVAWWGGEERAQRTRDAIAAFQRVSDIEIVSEFWTWGDYWTKLSAQVDGGTPPDVIQMDYRYLAQYARRGALLPLNPYLGKALEIEDFGKINLEACSADGNLYGVTLGVNTTALIVDADSWQEAGVEAPNLATTWAAFAEKCKTFANGPKRARAYATFDGSGSDALYEGWLISKGKALYGSDGKLGYDAAEATEWFRYWAGLRTAGACVPPDLQALYKDSPETSPVVLSIAAVDVIGSNQFLAYQNLTKRRLALAAMPTTKPNVPSCYMKPAMMFSVSAKCAAVDSALALINFVARDPRGALHLGVERGVPASPELREALTMDLDPLSSTTVHFVDALLPQAGTLPPSPPKGAGDAALVLRRVSQEVAKGELTPERGAAKLVAETAATLARA